MEVKVSERGLRLQAAALRSETVDLKTRIATLEQELWLKNNELARYGRGGGPAALSLGKLGPTIPVLASVPNYPPILTEPPDPLALHNIVFAQAGLPPYEPTASETSSPTCPDLLQQHENELPDLSVLPSAETARTLAHSVLQAGKYSPHTLEKIIDKEEIDADFRAAFREDGQISLDPSPSRFRCCMVVYLAMCLEQGVSGVDTTSNQQWAACRRIAMSDLASVVIRDDVACVQALLLLCVAAVHGPDSFNLWQLIGIAARTCLAIGIHRRDDVYLPMAKLSPGAVAWSSEDLAVHNRRRKNIFWSVYGLDKLCTFILHRPPSLQEVDIDLEVGFSHFDNSSAPYTQLPKASSCESQAPSASLTLWTQDLQARKLYGGIYRSLYSVTANSDRPRTEREAIIASFVETAQHWFAASRLRYTAVPFSDDTVKRQWLDDVLYHQMMIALHQPSPLLPDISSAYVTVLGNSARLTVDLFLHYSMRKELSVHWVNLYQAFVASSAIVYCYQQSQIRQDMVPIAREAFDDSTLRCRTLLSQLGRASPSAAAKYQALFERLVEATRTSTLNGSFAAPVANSLLSTNEVTGIDFANIDFTSLLQETSQPLPWTMDNGNDAQYDTAAGTSTAFDLNEPNTWSAAY